LKLSGTDGQIDQSKGISSLSAIRVRAKIDAFGVGAADKSVAAQGSQFQQFVHAARAKTKTPTLLTQCRRTVRPVFPTPLPGICLRTTSLTQSPSESIWSTPNSQMLFQGMSGMTSDNGSTPSDNCVACRRSLRPQAFGWRCLNAQVGRIIIDVSKRWAAGITVC
jgi:hypothetical protein